MSRSRQPGSLPAIFVHAGAGFHSHHNEKAHLEACDNAAKVAMAVLRAGGSAVDAVEIAIVTLENHEITNSGYGSNLTINGTVECDATIVDHLGRSGAVGAVEQVKNPISLARVILNHSTIELSLNRVPPNFLVGMGATDYAYENGLVTLHDDGLISPAAKERWLRWTEELRNAHRDDETSLRTDNITPYLRRPIKMHPAHLLATPRSLGSESPVNSPIFSGTTESQRHFSGGSHNTLEIQELGHSPGICSNSGQPASSKVRDPRCVKESEFLDIQKNDDADPCCTDRKLPTQTSTSGNASNVANDGASKHDAITDNITDTVGAIAVDAKGNIAAGSSSGGIGMKRRGRVGPAALVGIGTAVIPEDPNDPDGTCVAVVTSGTGEHIATTIAANTCASRIYHSQRKGEDGTYEDITEEEAMHEMIATDFMGHPGVVNSHCHGAIGIMAVKKTTHGVFLYFGHNTESFALASMTSQDNKPMCVMSRSNGEGRIAQGGRACRNRRYRVRRLPAYTDLRQ
ncbi:hypothetical protein MPDQ_006127 [Monascus purpureus]|uniref:Taspase, threonine aspartase, 1 n=1 Tax=Monascus purpureus TaxID=5098 RepID=A0A507R360_MONPU|nr:hypothetical protein MPDQ_006127 [Monascus purpureus]